MKIKGIKWLRLNTMGKREQDDVVSFLEQETESDNHIKEYEKFADITPFGDFHKNSPMNPYNIYDEMYWACLIGFSVNDACFKRIVGTGRDIKHELELDFIQGIDVWRIVDQHRLLIVPAAFYDWEEVRKKIEKAILPENHDKINQIVHNCKKASHDLEEKEHHTVLALPTGSILTFSSDDKDYRNKHKEAVDLFNSHIDSFLIVDGKTVERK